ncbi:hypothetical protein ACRAWF_32940 [Streptomyces sp. L7]
MTSWSTSPARGVPPDRILIGHCDNADDEGYLRELLDAGCTIGVDQFGFTHTASDEARVDLVVSLLEQGYAGQVVLSHDAHVMVTKYPPAVRDRLWPDWKPTRIFDMALPALRGRGVDESSIETLLVANPARLLARHDKA